MNTHVLLQDIWTHPWTTAAGTLVLGPRHDRLCGCEWFQQPQLHLPAGRDLHAQPASQTPAANTHTHQLDQKWHLWRCCG